MYLVKWSNIWSYTQQDYRSWPSEIEQQLQVVRICSNHHGKVLKLRFSNEYGQEDLVFKQVRICILTADKRSHGKTESEARIVTVNGEEAITLVPTANLISDEVELEFYPRDIIEIETQIESKTILRSGTVSYAKGGVEVFNYQLAGKEKILIKQEDIFRMVKENNRMFYIYGISGVEILTANRAETIVTFGDSLTQQGFWVEALKKRLLEAGMNEIAVLNRGIGGSRILKGQNPENDTYTRHGEAGLFRFEREVFLYGKVDAVICLHGINDLISRHDGTNEYPYSLADIKNGLRQYARIAHHRGTPIIIGTLAPLGHSIFYSDKLEMERQEMNRWIRRSEFFDGVIDFDRALQKAEEEKILEQAYDSGDGLHFSALGGAKIAEIIELSYVNSIIHTQKRRNKNEKDKKMVISNNRSNNASCNSNRL